MATYYVYAPFTGSARAQEEYCGGGNHPSRYYSSPLDIHRAGITGIYFSASSNITKIKVRFDDQVCSSLPGDPWENAVLIDVYNAGGCHIGSVSYSHVDNPITTSISGVYYYTNLLRIGDLSPDTCNCNGQFLCYSGIHVHMEGNGVPQNFSSNCGTNVYASSTWIYKWDSFCV